MNTRAFTDIRRFETLHLDPPALQTDKAHTGPTDGLAGHLPALGPYSPRIRPAIPAPHSPNPSLPNPHSPSPSLPTLHSPTSRSLLNPEALSVSTLLPSDSWISPSRTRRPLWQEAEGHEQGLFRDAHGRGDPACHGAEHGTRQRGLGLPLRRQIVGRFPERVAEFIPATSA